MRILSIENHRVLIEVDRTELDNIVNMIAQDQYNIGYGDGYNDSERMNDANMDDDRPKDDSQERDKSIV